MAAASYSKALFGLDAIETVKVTADGGIVKEVTARGTGAAKPVRGQTVTAHYTGKLGNGSKFDSSKDRGRPFQFPIGIGRVIQGWDEGIATMTKGEKAVLTCTYPYAYGEEGMPGAIPPRATLHFEVELIDFK